jgi:hypothetical protein
MEGNIGPVSKFRFSDKPSAIGPSIDNLFSIGDFQRIKYPTKK